MVPFEPQFIIILHSTKNIYEIPYIYHLNKLHKMFKIQFLCCSTFLNKIMASIWHMYTQERSLSYFRFKICNVLQ